MFLAYSMLEMGLATAFGLRAGSAAASNFVKLRPSDKLSYFSSVTVGRGKYLEATT